MKKLPLLGMAFSCMCAGFAQTWTMTAPRAWSRVTRAALLTVRNDGGFELRHTADQDWSIHGMSSLPVKPGDVFRLSCMSETLPNQDRSCAYSLSVTMWDEKGEVMDWVYGNRSALPGKPICTEFMIPPGAARIEPRIVGNGPTGVVVKDFRVEHLGNRLPQVGAIPALVSSETDLLKVSVSGRDATVTVTDRRTGRVWAPVKTTGRQFVTEVVKSGPAICATFINPDSMRTWKTFVSPLPKLPEVLVTVVGEGDMPDVLNYPQPFATKKGDRLIIPMNEGISFPVDEPDGIPRRLVTYGGHGVCMSFFGVQEDATGAGYMGIVETADDAAVTFQPPVEKATFAAGVSWEPQKGKFGYPRRIRFVFQDKGGYVAMCKRYRAYAKSQGKVKTFVEKAKERPLVERLLGAPNIWCWGSDKVAIAKDLKAAGIDRFLWSAGGSAKQVTELSRMEGVLVSRYDVYRDIYRPEQLEKLGWKKGGTNTDAWPEGAAWNSADSNDWRKAWGVKAKDGTWTYCGCMCDAVSAKYCRKHVGAELKTYPYNTRFIDVTTAAAWDVCENPAHPMTHSDSRAYRMDLLRLLGDDFGLVVGSETGHDAAVPYCDYFEGMLSLCHYRVPDSGRNIGEVWTNVPPRVAKFQVGAEYRLPLWELVYHDCLCAHWYWGDYNNKLPALWDRRDLFNVLYGTMGMYLFNEKQWAEDRDRFVRSYRITSPIARRTGYSEMLDHRILTPDRMVQRSVFADGTVVTVNFGSTAITLPEGGVLAAGAHQVTKK